MGVKTHTHRRSGSYLGAAPPHGHRVVVVARHPLGLGVDPGDLVPVIPEEPVL